MAKAKKAAAPKKAAKVTTPERVKRRAKRKDSLEVVELSVSEEKPERKLKSCGTTVDNLQFVPVAGREKFFVAVWNNVKKNASGNANDVNSRGLRVYRIDSDQGSKFQVNYLQNGEPVRTELNPLEGLFVGGDGNYTAAQVNDFIYQVIQLGH